MCVFVFIYFLAYSPSGIDDDDDISNRRQVLWAKLFLSKIVKAIMIHDLELVIVSSPYSSISQ